jgi:hypothetical protein
MSEKKKHNWGKGFVIPPRTSEADRLSSERAARIKNVMHSKTGRKNDD